MRYSHLLTVLSLFLLVPASITRAQKVSVSGNVYEKGTVKNSFQTPQGTITIILPDDMAAGDAIIGTVLYEPEGMNQKKKRNNLEQLLKYTLFLENGTPLRAIVNDDVAVDLISESPVSRSRVTFTIPSIQDQTSLHLILKDGGNQITGESRPPLMDKTLLMMPNFLTFDGIEGDKDKQNRESTPEIQTDKKIYMSGENAAISLPLVFGGIYMENTMVNAWCSFKGGQDSEPVKMDLSTLVGSPRKTVVQIPLNVYGPGEIILEDKNKKVIASQKIHVLKLEASCPKTSLMKNEETVLNVNVKGVKDCPADYLRLKLDNVIGSSVQLGQSNHEEIVIETVNLKYSKIKWDYTVQDEKEKKAKPYMDWENYESNAFSLKRSVTALQTGGFTINISLSYPSSVYNDPFRQQLDALKTVEQFDNWQNALKAVTCLGEHIKEGHILVCRTLSPITSPAELDEAKSRVYNIISRLRIGQEVIIDYFSCTLEAGKAAVENAITNVGNAPVNIEVIQSALRYAEHQAAIAENKPLKDAAAGMQKDDLLKLQKEINDVSQQLQMLNNIQKIFNDASKAAVNNMRASVDPGSNKNRQHIDFINAQIQDISFPEMEAANKETAMITVVFNPKEYSIEKKNQSPPQRTWTVSNFRFEMDGLPDKGITKVEALKWETKISKADVPTKPAYPYIEFKIPFDAAEPWQQWLENKSPRNGNIQYIDEKNGSFITVDLKNVLPISAVKSPGGDLQYKIAPENAVLDFSPEILSSLMSAVDPGRVLRPDDLVAVFNPQSKKLIYDPQYKEQVFAKFQPRLRADGKSNVSVMTFNRKMINMVIDLIPGTMFELVNESKDSIKYDEYGFESTGEKIGETTDSKGASYRFYKDAKCKRWKEPNQDGKCIPVYVRDSTGKLVESGKSERIETTGESHCYKGTEFCTEMYIVAIIVYTYDDANCKRLVNVKTYGGWSCE